MMNPITDSLASYPRANLLQAPVIIHKLPRLSTLMGQSIYVLRDDLTGFGLGGNKTRKLDFLVGDAIAKGATSLVTIKATSFSRNAAVAASACGLDLHVVLPGAEPDQNPFSQSIFAAAEARLHYETKGTAALPNRLESVVASLRARGERVYVLHPGGSDPIGALSYVNILGEICDFTNRTGVHFSHVMHSSSSAGTQAGLLVGQCIVEHDARIIGISASRSTAEQAELVSELAESTARLLGTSLDEGRIIVDDGFVGPGYAKSSKEGDAAAGAFARLEGILLDPVYTSKAAAALLHYASHDALDDGNVLFIHTGGNAGLYY